MELQRVFGAGTMERYDAVSCANALTNFQLPKIAEP